MAVSVSTGSRTGSDPEFLLLNLTLAAATGMILQSLALQRQVGTLGSSLSEVRNGFLGYEHNLPVLDGS